MTEAQKYQKKKNALLITFMILLLVLVCLICYIFIYVKMHPKKEYDSPDTIEIVTMTETDYEDSTDNLTYTEVTESTKFNITIDNEKKELEINENKEVVNSETKEKVEILLNKSDINSNIKLLYQTENDNLILTEDGKLYRLLENTLNVGQILTNTEVKNIVKFKRATDDVYVLTSEDKVININTQKEYDGIIRTLKLNNNEIYVYEDYSISLEKGKVITDPEGNRIKFNIVFENKLIDDRNVIYEIDFTNKTVTTSKLGNLVKAGYGKVENSDYHINIETNTGIHSFESSYYYTK